MSLQWTTAKLEDSRQSCSAEVVMGLYVRVLLLG